MLFSPSLSLYFGKWFAKNAVLVFVAAFCLMLIIDFMELARRGGDLDVPVAIIALISATRLPTLAEQLLPFAVLIGALLTLVALSRRSELVIARASGVSAWQFLLPLLIVAAGFGAFATFAYNPLATQLKQTSDRLLAERFGGTAASLQPDQEIWFRQADEAGSTIIRALSSGDEGTTLFQMSAFSFDEDGAFMRRVDTPRAELRNGAWHMATATLVDDDGAQRTENDYSVPTTLSPAEVSGRFTPANHLPIWQLSRFAEKAQLAGLSSHHYKFQFQALLARPLLLMAMVLVAATVSLRFSRQGGTTQLVIAGLSAGFIVFVINEIAGDLGAAGLVPAVLAAWAPPLAAGLFGVTVLLHLEDG
ncbi:MAG: LPS export ABC transporter permease LptG [Pseudomonadota bacterium]